MFSVGNRRDGHSFPSQRTLKVEGRKGLVISGWEPKVRNLKEKSNFAASVARQLYLPPTDICISPGTLISEYLSCVRGPLRQLISSFYLPGPFFNPRLHHSIATSRAF